MRISQKLIVGFGVVVISTATFGIVNIIDIKNIGSETETHHKIHVPIRFAVTHIRIDLEEIIRAVEEYDADWMTKEESTKEIKEKKENIEDLLGRLVAAAGLPTPEELEDIKGSINEFYGLSAKLFELHGRSREERTPIMKEFDEKVEEIAEKLDVMLEEVDKASEVSLASIRDTIASSRTITILVLANVILVALGIAFAISRSISSPIIKLKNAAVEIGKGRLNTKIDIKSKDEIGDLANSFSKMAKDLGISMQKEKKELAAAAAAADAEKKKAAELAKEITERKKAEEQQRQLMKDLEEMNKIMTGREIRMIELKKEVNELSKELGRPAPYEVSDLG